MASVEPQISFYNSPIGWIQICCVQESISGLTFMDEPQKEAAVSGYGQKVQAQLGEYFNGTRKQFELNCVPEGTSFQKQVWDAVKEVSYGSTESYKDIALKLNDANAVRAVGTSNGKNPILIIIPCHRIVGSDKSLKGYAAGLERKKFLLQLELKHSKRPNELF